MDSPVGERRRYLPHLLRSGCVAINPHLLNELCGAYDVGPVSPLRRVDDASGQVVGSSSDPKPSGDEVTCRLLSFLGEALSSVRDHLYIFAPLRRGFFSGSCICGDHASSPMRWLSALYGNLAAIADALGICSSPIVIPIPYRDKRTRKSAEFLFNAVVHHACAVRLFRRRCTHECDHSENMSTERCCCGRLQVPMLVDSRGYLTDMHFASLWGPYFIIGGGPSMLDPSTTCWPGMQLLSNVVHSGSCPLLQLRNANPEGDTNLGCNCENVVGEKPTVVPNESGRDVASCNQCCRCGEYNRVIVAGTFDRLHSGHKLLLTATVLVANAEVGIAVTTGELLRTKVNDIEVQAASGVQAFIFRARAVISFVQLLLACKGCGYQTVDYTASSVEGLLIDACGTQFPCCFQHKDGSTSNRGPVQRLDGRDRELTHRIVSKITSAVADREVSESLEFGLWSRNLVCNEHYDAFLNGDTVLLRLYNINDPVGPAGTLDFDALVVSDESYSGGLLVNRTRIDSGMKPVALVRIPVLQGVPRESLLPIVHVISDAFVHCEAFCDRARSGLNGLPASRTVASSGSEEIFESEHHADAHLLRRGYSGNPNEKLSSSDYRLQQTSMLHCHDIVALKECFCSAFRSYFRAPQCVSEFYWQIICTAHTKPWRLFYTLPRIERAVASVVERNPFLRDLVITSLFLFSLLSTPCEYLLPWGLDDLTPGVDISLRRTSFPHYSIWESASSTFCSDLLEDLQFSRYLLEPQMRSLQARESLALVQIGEHSSEQLESLEGVGRARSLDEREVGDRIRLVFLVMRSMRCALMGCIQSIMVFAFLGTSSINRGEPEQREASAAEYRCTRSLDWQSQFLLGVQGVVRSIVLGDDSEPIGKQRLRGEYFFMDDTAFTKYCSQECQDSDAKSKDLINALQVIERQNRTFNVDILYTPVE